jgi:hypothetical protein
MLNLPKPEAPALSATKYSLPVLPPWCRTLHKGAAFLSLIQQSREKIIVSFDRLHFIIMYALRVFHRGVERIITGEKETLLCLQAGVRRESPLDETATYVQ